MVPFLGDAVAARALLGRLAALELGPADELIVADNTPGRIVDGLATEPVRVAPAADRRSASYARNAGAASAAGEWLLFTDADCVLPADLLQRYFEPAPGPGCAIVAGEVVGDPAQGATAARWARERRGAWVAHHQSWGLGPAGVTANLLVRREAFERLGGFRIGGGGDLDLCWRARAAGWELAYRPAVAIRHRDRETLAGLAGQAIAYGGHQRRLRELHGPAVPRPALARPLARALGGAAVWTARGERERAAFKLIDGLWAALVGWGWLSRGAGARAAD